MNKNLSVETLRGLAIILVVMGHVIGSRSDGGMRVADDSFLRHLYYTFQYLRMPLFTVISGWVYALRPAIRQNLADFTVKKIRRILVPMIFVGGTYYVLQSVVPGTNRSYELHDIWRISIFPYTFYWYLHSLFIVFLIVSVTDALSLASTFRKWLVFFLLSMLLLIIRDQIIPESFPNYFGFKGAIYLLPFFLIGTGIKNFNSYFGNRYFLMVSSMLLASGLIVQQLAWYKIVDLQLTSAGGAGLLIGVTGVIVCLHLKFQSGWLIWMGNYAYSIFLFHSFGTSGGRIILNTLGIHHTTVVFFTSLLLGLFLPVAVEKIADRSGLTRLLFLGRAYQNHIKVQPVKA